MSKVWEREGRLWEIPGLFLAVWSFRRHSTLNTNFIKDPHGQRSFEALCGLSQGVGLAFRLWSPSEPRAAITQDLGLGSRPPLPLLPGSSWTVCVS